MKNILTIALVLVGSSAFAATLRTPVTMDMELQFNGKLVSKPRMVVQMGEKGEITQRTVGADSAYSIEVKPTLGATANSVQLSFIVKQNKNGKIKVLSQPRVIVLNGETAALEEQAKGQSSVKLTVTPTF